VPIILGSGEEVDLLVQMLGETQAA
jgi:hypothetical protein